MFKEKLKQLRIERNLTQSDVAKAIGVSAATIGNYEQGTREPKNNELWKKLADFFTVSVDELMDKSYVKPSDRILSFEEAESAQDQNSPSKHFRRDVRIIYHNVDLTPLVFCQPGQAISTTKEQRQSYLHFSSRSGHAIFARENFIKILEDLKYCDDIKKHFDHFAERLYHDVIYWYRRCWYDIDEGFLAVKSLESLYDRIDRCFAVDKMAEYEFTLVPLKGDYTWLRDKLRD